MSKYLSSTTGLIIALIGIAILFLSVIPTDKPHNKKMYRVGLILAGIGGALVIINGAVSIIKNK